MDHLFLQYLVMISMLSQIDNYLLVGYIKRTFLNLYLKYLFCYRMPYQYFIIIDRL